MLASLLKQPILTERRTEPRREAVVLPYRRPQAATPKPLDWWDKYPCIRICGAAFEAEFHPNSDEQS